jgi:hypothetical protein
MLAAFIGLGIYCINGGWQDYKEAYNIIATN